MMPSIMGALLLAGVMAAALSSATTFLSLVGFSVSHDIFPQKKQLNEDNDKSLLKFSRLVMLIVGIVALIISFFFPPNLFWLAYYVGTVFASSWGPVAFMSIWSKTITARGAFWGIISGFAGNVILRFCDSLGWINLPSYLNPILVGGLLSYLVIVLVSRLDTVSDVEHQQRLALHKTPQQECNEKQAKHTQWVAIAVIVFGILLSALQLTYYVYPYQLNTGQLTSANQLNWFSIEAFLALAWAGIFVPLGVIAHKVIVRSYITNERIE